MSWLYLLATALLLIYFSVKRHFEYWKRRNVPGPGFVYFARGFCSVVFRKKSFGDLFTEIYKDYEGYPFVGVFASGSPVLLVRDPEFIKHIVSTDFKSFYDNGGIADKNVDPILGRNPFFLRGEEWKTTRSQLTPGFTSGKMKFVFPLVEHVCDDLVAYLKKNSKGVDAKDVCTRFTIDSVATSAFGLEGKSFESDNADFMQIALDFFGPQNRTTVMFSLAFLAPWVFSIYNFKIVPKHIDKKLIDIVTASIKHRKENDVTRNDFLQYIMQLKDTVKGFSDVDATGHVASFFVDGYETSSIVLTYILYELARNQEVQDRLREEINEFLQKNKGKFSYEGLEEMEYLEACVWESLRKNSAFQVHCKMCTNEFKYTTKSDDFKKMSVTMEPEMVAFLPLEGFQTDPKYFEDPLEYRPERMLNKEELYSLNRDLGQRFGLLQVKLAIAHVVKNFKVRLNNKTVLPVRSSPWYLINSPKDPIYLDLEEL